MERPGPISDNAGGIAEMALFNPEAPIRPSRESAEEVGSARSLAGGVSRLQCGAKHV